MEAGLVADEGGLGPVLPSNRAALEILTQAIERAGLAAGDEVAVAVDLAAGQLLGEDGYRLASEGRTVDADELVAEVVDWAASFPVVSVEDPLGDDDWNGWARASTRLAGLQLVGDDLFVTDLERVRRGVARGVASGVLVKPNQTGTLSGALDVVEEARRAGYATVLSARSGDTEDSWLADLAVGWRTGQIKVGSTTRSERTAKWNRLLQIEAELGADAEFAGRAALVTWARPPPRKRH
jgi:enolase